MQAREYTHARMRLAGKKWPLIELGGTLTQVRDMQRLQHRTW
jgi:hypothetical protein